MPLIIEPPIASATPEAHADFLELAALDPAEDGASLRELVRDLGIGSTIDGYREEEGEDNSGTDIEDEDAYESIAEAAFAVIDDREAWCAGRYPYRSEHSVLRPEPDVAKAAYVFMMLLSRFGVSAGPSASYPTRAFEEICTIAARNYLGEGAHAIRFGFPRSGELPRAFPEALDRLCRDMREGQGHKPSALSSSQNDATLDIVAWKKFSDNKAGKIIAFGQCASGANWKEKRSELAPPHDWCSLWMMENPYVTPIRFFFVPHHVPEIEWERTNRLGGVLFDRCRITEYVDEIPHDLLESIESWIQYVINNNLLE